MTFRQENARQEVSFSGWIVSQSSQLVPSQDRSEEWAGTRKHPSNSHLAEVQQKVPKSKNVRSEATFVCYYLTFEHCTSRIFAAISHLYWQLDESVATCQFIEKRKKSQCDRTSTTMNSSTPSFVPLARAVYSTSSFFPATGQQKRRVDGLETVARTVQRCVCCPQVRCLLMGEDY